MKDRFKFRGIHPVLGELQEIKFIDFIHNTVDFGDGDIFNIEDVKIQQSTGLKDKNGKLIYEGDILQSEEYPFKNENGYNYAVEVLWDDASATFYYYTFRISNNVVGRSTGNTGELNEYEDWEVIGNKFENPELLKECENE